jgi:fructose-1,6-bisphosphatase/inositol monophosphatase family enzyme
MTPNYQNELACAIDAALGAGALLRRAFHAEPDSSADHDLEAETGIHQALMSAFPQYGYRGEEMGPAALPQDDDNHLWLVDPNDGTSSFKQGYRGAAVSIALLRNGRPVLGVVYAYCAPDDNGDLFTWAEGLGPIKRNGREVSIKEYLVPQTVLVSQDGDRNPVANASIVAPMRFRTMPSIAYRLALVAAGEARVAVSVNAPVDWDYAGGHALLLGAGMDLYDFAGQPVRYMLNGYSSCSHACFGGKHEIAREIANRNWIRAFGPKPSNFSPYELCWPAKGASIQNAGMLSRAQGCLLGQLAGDSLGSLVEFKSATSIRKLYPEGVRLLEDGGVWWTLAGQPTDDSEMALILARSIVDHGHYDPDAAARGYAWWCDSRPFDIGITTGTAVRAASRAMAAGRPLAEASRNAALKDSQANGGLMRVSPLGILAAAAAAGSGGEWAMQDTALTHPNPVCQHASRIFVETIAFAIRTGVSRQEIYDFALLSAQTEATPEPVTDAITVPHPIVWTHLCSRCNRLKVLPAGLRRRAVPQFSNQPLLVVLGDESGDGQADILDVLKHPSIDDLLFQGPVESFRHPVGLWL